MMWRIAFGLFVLSVAATAAPSAGHSQGPAMCGNRADVVAALAQRYSEAPVSIGLSNTGHVLEVLASPNGSWSVLLTGPNGRSCLVAAGDSWQPLPVQTSGNRS